MIKKNLIIVSAVIFLVSSLNARMNPFEPTQTYKEEKKVLINSLKIAVNADDGTRTIKLKAQEETSVVTKVKKTKTGIVVVKKEPKVIESKKPLEEIIFKEPVKKVAINTKKTIKKKEIKTYKYNLLSFVNINITDDIMNLSTKYKLKKYFILKDEKKLVFDYIGKKRFYTKRETLSSHKDFNKIIIGAHPESYYFRVVIQTTEEVSSYKINIDKKGLVTIKCIR